MSTEGGTTSYGPPPIEVQVSEIDGVLCVIAVGGNLLASGEETTAAPRTQAALAIPLRLIDSARPDLIEVCPGCTSEDIECVQDEWSCHNCADRFSCPLLAES